MLTQRGVGSRPTSGYDSAVPDPSGSGRVDMLTSPVAAARAADATGAWVKSKREMYLIRGSVGIRRRIKKNKNIGTLLYYMSAPSWTLINDGIFQTHTFPSWVSEASIGAVLQPRRHNSNKQHAPLQHKWTFQRSYTPWMIGTPACVPPFSTCDTPGIWSHPHPEAHKVLLIFNNSI